MGRKRLLIIELIAGLFIASVISFSFFFIFYVPSGNDIWGHMFKTRFLADQLASGNFYPLYSTDWYNGIQLYRYWPIFTYYITGIITLFTGDAVITYYVFLGLLYFIGYLGWCLIADREQRRSFLAIGLIWWFLPDNLRVLFSEGNLARALITAMLPLFLYFFTYFIKEKKKFIPTVIMVFILTNIHFMITAMCAIIFCIYGFFYGLKKRTWHLGFIAFICGFLLSGITLLPGVAGGVVSDGSSASVLTMADWSQDLFKSIFYWDRNKACLIFGLFALLAAFVTISKKTSKCGTIISLVFFVLSDVMFLPVLMQLPLSQVWWMSRFAPMCYALILYEFGFTKPKKTGTTILCLLLCIDIGFSYSSFLRPDETNLDYMMFDQAVENTDSRLGVLDESLFGSYPSYAAYGKVPYLQGWAIQGATIKSNIISATESMKLGWYGYTFRSMLELGCDSVVINRNLLHGDDNELFKWGAEYGYQLVGQTDNIYLFDNTDITGDYGVNFSYSGIAIGSSSDYICYMYPDFIKGASDNISDYSFDELSRYDKIYLSNFECDDFEETQNFIWELAQNGTEVYIDSTHIPINFLDIRSIFRIESKFINTEGSVDLKYKDVHCKLEFPYEWNATYLTTDDESVELYSADGIGAIAKKGNITVIGLNIVFLNIENKSDELKSFLDILFDLESRPPVYELVPVSYEYSKNIITIRTQKPCITSLAWQDNFDGDIGENNNLVTVEANETTIHIFYKYFGLGIATAFIGVIATFTSYFLIRRKRYEETK